MTKYLVRITLSDNKLGKMSPCAFPLKKGTEGTLDFRVPGGVRQRCVFVGALVPFPVTGTCEASNVFELR